MIAVGTSTLRLRSVPMGWKTPCFYCNDDHDTGTCYSVSDALNCRPFKNTGGLLLILPSAYRRATYCFPRVLHRRTSWEIGLRHRQRIVSYINILRLLFVFNVFCFSVPIRESLLEVVRSTPLEGLISAGVFRNAPAPLLRKMLEHLEGEILLSRHTLGLASAKLRLLVDEYDRITEELDLGSPPPLEECPTPPISSTGEVLVPVLPDNA